jgi:hypothetical protein
MADPTEGCHGTADQPAAAATAVRIVACGFPNVVLALSRGFQTVRLAMVGKPTVRVSIGWWRCQYIDSLLRPCGCPPDQVSAALNVEPLRSTCTVMGLCEAWHCETVEVELAPGDTLLLYTDGITEAANADGLPSPRHP